MPRIELNGVAYGGGGGLASDADALRELLGIVDYVIEEDSALVDGVMWTWVKWSSGRAEIHGACTLTGITFLTSAWNNGWYRTGTMYGRKRLPIDLVDDTSKSHCTIENRTLKSNDGLLALPQPWSSSYPNTKYTSGFYIIRNGAPSSGATFTSDLCYDIHGWWK